ncbi:uncharacterized protein LOC135822545 [Sycon ciliatum]|uniref:uncharacterized protein LOC135822545 n=1 Tax=Sycon ciliatum TaxID=27933 RepID=UPI0020A9A55E|eukprot:scpid67071/ scgid28934/ RNA-binding protein Nova-1; Neuro-oncological ventral antigen 1; Ventral neuron-specific protein 1
MGEPNPKRANGGPGPIDENANVVYKFLVDSNEAGHLIGSKGSSVDAIQNECGSKIRIASNGQHFPGTQRRTLMIQGVYTSVQRGIDILLDRVYDERLRNRQTVETGLLGMEVIVPNSTAGKIIGRGGENIAKVQAECNVQITVHKHGTGEYNQERRVTMQANNSVDDLRKAMHNLLDWVSKDGQSLNFPNVRYGEDAEQFAAAGTPARGGSSSGYDEYSRRGSSSGHPDQAWATPGPDRRFSASATGPPPRQAGSCHVQVKATLEAPIPDSLCWSLLRDNGVRLDMLGRETGASVSVQHSGELDDGQLIRNSLAIIKGTLRQAQAALLEVERLILTNPQ